jgi:hypothetical protein
VNEQEGSVKHTRTLPVSPHSPVDE